MADSLICSVAGCGKTVRTRGLCLAHYKKFLKYGDPLIIKNRERYGPNHCQKEDCPAAVILKNHVRYIQNSNVRKKKVKEWGTANRERVLQYKAKWNASNPEFNSLWCAANRDLVRSHKANRRARKKQAMPLWLTPDHISQINAVYAEAQRLSIETGVTYHVDHIVPLNGRVVCGLHVPWNLRAIPAVENLRRPRIYRDGME